MSSEYYSRLDRLTDDSCYLNQRFNSNKSIYDNEMYIGKYENASKCVYNKQSFYTPQNPRVVDVESELLGLTRPSSKCNCLKYNSKCIKSKNCISTKNAPIILNRDVCPIFGPHNLPKIYSSGFDPKHVYDLC